MYSSSTINVPSSAPGEWFAYQWNKIPCNLNKMKKKMVNQKIKCFSSQYFLSVIMLMPVRILFVCVSFLTWSWIVESTQISPLLFLQLFSITAYLWFPKETYGIGCYTFQPTKPLSAFLGIESDFTVSSGALYCNNTGKWSTPEPLKGPFSSRPAFFYICTHLMVSLTLHFFLFVPTKSTKHTRCCLRDTRFIK